MTHSEAAHVDLEPAECEVPEFQGSAERWGDIAAWRKAARQALISKRRNMQASEREAKSERIAAELDRIIGRPDRHVIGLYWPIKAEPNLYHWAERISGQGARLALPVVIKMGWPLEFRLWRPGDKLERGHWNIPVPANGPAVFPNIFIAPLVGFDPENYRLGYGGGFYDRTIAAALRRPFLIGVGFSECSLPTIYPQPHDIPMDAIVTDR